MLYRIWKLAIKELIQLMRDKWAAPFMLLGPLSELLMVAWSASQGIQHLPTAVLDWDRSTASRELIVAMANSETFEPYLVDDMEALTLDIEHGRALAAWVIPHGFESQLLDPNDRPAIQLVVDGADAMSAATASDVAQGLTASYGQRLALDAAPTGGG